MKTTANVTSKIYELSSTTEGSSLLIILPVIFGALFLILLIFGIYYLLVRFHVAKGLTGEPGADGKCAEHGEKENEQLTERIKTFKNVRSIAPASPSVGRGASVSLVASKLQGGSTLSTSAGSAHSAQAMPTSQLQPLATTTTISPGPPSLLDPRFGNMDSKLYLDVNIDEPTKSDLDVNLFTSGLTAKLAPKTWGMSGAGRLKTAAPITPQRPKTTMATVATSSTGRHKTLTAGAKGRSPSGQAKVTTVVSKNRPNSRQQAGAVSPLNVTGAKKSAALALVPKSRSASSSNSSRNGKQQKRKKKGPATATASAAARR